jgi:TFIIF-interacting CTD phosphatase-like protein
MPTIIYKTAREAKAVGSKFYNGKPCIHCGQNLRYSSVYSCVNCTKKRSQMDYKFPTIEQEKRNKIYENSDKRKLNKIKEHIKRHYNLSIEEYNDLFKKQKGSCAICFKKFINSPNVDHDHVTNKVRGLLCKNCNMGLGQFNDSIEKLQNAINYLKLNRDSVSTLPEGASTTTLGC